MEPLIVGMVAHVDAGKTTLTESLLYHGGALAELGRVDHGTAFLDTAELEKQRGITIYSKEARFSYKKWDITLLDTPGHIDFSPEMERCLQVLDYCVLVISGTDGVDSHSEAIWSLLKCHNIPVFLFVNKMDLQGTSIQSCISELQDRLDVRIVNFSWNLTHNSQDEFLEDIALCDESLLADFQGEFSTSRIADAVRSRNVFPCYFGSALRGDGVAEFLEGIATYVVDKDTRLLNQKKLGGRVFKITRDPQGNRLTHLKICSGNLRVRDFIPIGEHKEKVHEIRLYSGNKFVIEETIGSGTVCAVTGLSESRAGDCFGTEAEREISGLSEAVLTYLLEFSDGTDGKVALPKLKQLEEEDPSLSITWLEERGRIQVRLLGTVQEEVLSAVIAQRFGFQVNFGERAILYRETISLAKGTKKVEGVGHFEPLRHYAEVLLHLEPLPAGAGLEILSDCPTEELGASYQQLVLSQLRETTLLGRLTGAPLTDMRITLVGGRAHQKHSAGGDFREACYRALHQGLRQCTSVLLEPWYAVTLRIPKEFVGRALSDFTRMGGTCEILSQEEGESFLRGEVSLGQLGNYSSSVTSYTGGRGTYRQEFLGYRPCVDAASVLAKSDFRPEVEGSSIFCKHGGGYTVPWDEVSQQMHCDSKLPRAEFEPMEPKVLQQRCRVFADSLAEDDALMEIFQRTYGKISRKSFGSQREKPVQSVQLRPQKMKPKFLLVDGYNIIFAWERLESLGRDNLDSARQSLLNILSNYQAFYGGALMVVFDAYKVPGGVGSVEDFHNIQVVYTKEAETADMYIERSSHRLASEFQVRVATSDRLEQMIILGQGAYRVSARGFWEEIEQMEKAMQAYLS